MRVEIYIEQWGGHAGTSAKRLRLTDHDWMLSEAEFDIVADEAPTAKWFRVFVATPKGAGR